MRIGAANGNSAIRDGLDWLLASAAGTGWPLVQFHDGGEAGLGPFARAPLDADAAREALESGRHLADVRADQAQAQAYGIQGVPFFVIDGKYGVSGAQPPEAFAQIARQVWGEKQA